MKKYIAEMLSNRKQRKFKESTDLQIQLRDYDPEKDKRFSGVVRLPNVPHPRISIGVIGNLLHCGNISSYIKNKRSGKGNRVDINRLRRS